MTEIEPDSTETIKKCVFLNRLMLSALLHAKIELIRVDHAGLVDPDRLGHIYSERNYCLELGEQASIVQVWN